MPPRLRPPTHNVLPSPSTSTRTFSTTTPLPRRTRFQKTEGTRNGFIDFMSKTAPRLNVPSPKHNIPVYLSLTPRSLPTKPGTNAKKAISSRAPGVSRKQAREEIIDWEGIKERGGRYTPFPLNQMFHAHPVISTEFREEIVLRMKAERSVRRISAELNCEMERVAAVIRLMEVERRWVEQNRPLCTEMQSRIHSMMPLTPYTPFPRHESITDLPIHPSTNNQLFLSVPESMSFTRQHASEALGLLPADVRMPHSELIEVERMKQAGVSIEDMVKVESEREEREMKEIKEKRERRERREGAGKVVETERFRFRLKPASAGSVGHRYGVPAEDRKRGVVKIPTRVV
ncbi:hypothetical protein TWF730_003304 [Orbilia blumenaviensis]|uniref:Uncharacterized protein n=1 Tax=Orbilia blumenaviensis TaxID=1796055 RepID=A0AAV9U4U7_9PEZI